MRGVTLATYTRYRNSRGLKAPTKEQLRNISDEEVRDIYFNYYFLESGADKLPFPLCVAHFDLAVNGGTGRSAQALREAGRDFNQYNNWREAWYRRLPTFPEFGTGWLNRVNALRKTFGGAA